MFIGKPWYEGNQKQKVEEVLVWIQFSELDLRYRSLTALSKLASILGIPIMADKNTGEKNVVPYASVLIEKPILEKLPKHIHFEDETVIIQTQDIFLEWHPIQCAKCKNYDHEADNCKKQDGTMVCRPKQTQKGQEPRNQNQTTKSVQVGNTRANTPTSHNTYTFKTPINNSFRELQGVGCSKEQAIHHITQSETEGRILPPHGQHMQLEH